MFRYILLRSFELIITVLIASFIIFTVINLLPGDAADVSLGLETSGNVAHNLRSLYGLNDPFFVRYSLWLYHAFIGNFGYSLSGQASVLLLIEKALFVSLPLAFIAFILALIIAIPLGLFATIQSESYGKLAVGFFSYVALCIPNFLWGAFFSLLIVKFSLNWPIADFPGWQSSPFTSLQALLLPALALSLPQGAILTRVIRVSMQEELKAPYIRTAKGKGLSTIRLVFYHLLPNGLIPLFTLMGMQFSIMVGGAIIVEKFFSLPGIGSLLIRALDTRDTPLFMGCTLTIVVIVLLFNWASDLLSHRLDPRPIRGNPL